MNIFNFRIAINGDKKISYKILYNKNKMVSAVLNNDTKEIEVFAPFNYPIDQIEKFIDINFKKIYEMVENRKNHIKRIDLTNNIIYIKNIKYIIKPILTIKSEKYEIINNKIFIHVKDFSNYENIVKKMLLNETKDYIDSRVNYWSKKMNIEYNKVHYKWYTGVWGKCSWKTKDIYLSIKLFALSQEMIDYVIIHELAHIIHNNHSKEFWDFVKIFSVNYNEIKQKMKFEK